MSYKWPHLIDMKEINSDNRWPRHTQQKPVTPLVYKTIKTQWDYDKTWRKYMLSLETGTTRCQRRVWRYQRGNQNPYIEEGQTTQWPKDTKGVIRIRISRKDRQHNGQCDSDIMIEWDFFGEIGRQMFYIALSNLK
jgi:hypothetical protein